VAPGIMQEFVQPRRILPLLILKKLNDSGKIEEPHGKFTVLFLQESTGVDKTHVWDGILFAVDIIKLGIPWINPIISVLREMRYMCTH
jgi:hypothetical protein